VCSRDGCQRLGEVQLQDPEGDALHPDRTSALRGRIDPLEILHLEIDDVPGFGLPNLVEGGFFEGAGKQHWLSLELGPKLVVGTLRSGEEPDAVGQLETLRMGTS